MKTVWISLLMLLLTNLSFSQKEVSGIIEKYTHNIGGKKAWKAIKSFEIDITGKVGTTEFTSHQYMLKPNHFKMIFRYPTRERVLSYNGFKGYISSDGQLEDMPLGMEAEMHEEADFYDELILYQEKGYKPTLEKDTIIDNKEYYKVSLNKNPTDTQWYYINKSNYLVEIIEEYSEEQQWEGTLFKTVFSDYQKVKDVYFPKSMTLYSNDSFLIEYKIDKVILNPKLSKKGFTLKQ